MMKRATLLLSSVLFAACGGLQSESVSKTESALLTTYPQIRFCAVWGPSNLTGIDFTPNGNVQVTPPGLSSQVLTADQCGNLNAMIFPWAVPLVTVTDLSTGRMAFVNWPSTHGGCADSGTLMDTAYPRMCSSSEGSTDPVGGLGSGPVHPVHFE